MRDEVDEVRRRTTVSPRRPARIAAEARLAAHPGYRGFQDQLAFMTTLDGVFWPNYRSLKSLLDQAATDRGLGIELIQNVYDDAVARQFNAEASRRLHNYVAATMSLVEHSRRLMRDRDDDVSRAWDERRADLLTNGEVPFMIDLRVFIQHRALPVLAHSLHIGNPNSADETWESEVELGRERLLKWDGWKAAARQFLTAQDEAIKLRSLVATHADVVYQANAWLLRLLLDDNRVALADANRLVIERNQAMLGCTYEDAEAFTLKMSAERQQPRPDRKPPTTTGSSVVAWPS